MKTLAATFTLAVLSSGCASTAASATPPSGVLYTGVQGVSPATQAHVTDGVRPGPK